MKIKIKWWFLDGTQRRVGTDIIERDSLPEDHEVEDFMDHDVTKGVFDAVIMPEWYMKHSKSGHPADWGVRSIEEV